MLKRWLQRFIITLSAVIIVCALTVTWLVTSTSGLRWISAQLIPVIPDLSIGNMEGRLIGPLTINDLHYRNEQLDVVVEHARLDWQPKTLLASTLTITDIDIVNPAIKHRSASAPSKPSQSGTDSLETQLNRLQLPLAIQINHLNIHHGSYSSSDTGNANSNSFLLEQFSLSGAIDNERLSVNSLTIKSNFLDADGTAIIAKSAVNKTEGTLQWTLYPPTYTPITGKTILSGNSKQLTLNNTINTPYNALLKVVLTNPLNNLTVNGTIDAKKVELQKINAQWPLYSTTIGSQFRGKLSDLTTENTIKLNLNNPQHTVLDISNTITWKNNILRHKGGVTISDNPVTVAINGEVNTQSPEPTFAITADWRELAWPQQPELSSPSGSLSLSGQPNNYQFLLHSTFENKPASAGTVAKGTLDINGKGNLSSAELTHIELSGPVGKVKGQGRGQWQPDLSATLALSGEAINPGVIATQWPGKLKVVLSADTTVSSDGQPTIKARADISGTLRNYPLTLQSTGYYSSEKIVLDALTLNSGNSHISASGTLENNHSLHANWIIDSPQLETLVPTLSGKLKSQGQLHFSHDWPQITTKLLADIEASNIALDNIRVDGLVGNIDIDWHENTQTSSSNSSSNSLAIKAEGIAIDAFKIIALSLDGKGTPEDHQLKLASQLEQVDLNASVSGQLTNPHPQWLFTLQSATINPFKLAPWQLTAAVSGSVDKEQQTINQHCWQSNVSTLCLAGQRQALSSAADFSLRDLPIDYFTAFFPQGLNWQDSHINGDGSVSLAASGQLDSQIQLTTTKGLLGWQETAETTDSDKTPQLLHIDPGQLSLLSDKDKTTLSLQLPLEAQPGINASVTLKNNHTDWLKRSLNGELALHLDSIAPLGKFIPDSSDAKGELDARWQFGGSIATPWLEGKMTLNNGQIQLTSPGIQLDQLSATLTGDKQQGIRYTASAISGGGSLQASGDIDLLQNAPQFSMHVNGENFQALAIDEASVYISPDITINNTQGIIDISGTLTIPKATITPTQLPASAVTISDDQVIVDSQEQQISVKTQQKITTNIEVILKDDVFVEGFGFKGNTIGNLQITKAVDGPTLGRGEIRIANGEYRAYGQGLVIDKGNILFAGGPVNKPGIDLKALRRPAENITVGVFARGTIAEPTLTIFSEPAMSQQEQLSWLILGRPLEQSSEGESNALSQLLLSLSLSKGDAIVKGFSDTFKLDTVRIKTGSDEAGAASDNDLAELVLGKYLTPDLYVSYGIGLFKPVNVLSLEYSLGRRWKLKTESSAEAAGGDLIYTIEK